MRQKSDKFKHCANGCFIPEVIKSMQEMGNIFEATATNYASILFPEKLV